MLFSYLCQKLGVILCTLPILNLNPKSTANYQISYKTIQNLSNFRSFRRIGQLPWPSQLSIAPYSISYRNARTRKIPLIHLCNISEIILKKNIFYTFWSILWSCPPVYFPGGSLPKGAESRGPFSAARGRPNLFIRSLRQLIVWELFEAVMAAVLPHWKWRLKKSRG